MEEILKGTKIMLIFSAMAEVVVFVAMMADLASGLYKAKIRGEYTQSELLKRTGFKFCLYEGSMLIALCVDVLIHFTHLYEFLNFPDVMVHLPLFSFGMAIYWCAVEYFSIREKASAKMHSRMAKVDRLASMLNREELTSILCAAIKASKAEKKETTHDNVKRMRNKRPR